MKKIKLTFLGLLLALGAAAQSQNVGIGTISPDASAKLEVNSTSQGFLPPRMTQAQMNAIASPAEGLIIYCTDCSPKGLYINTSSPTANWVSSSSGGSPLTLDCANQTRTGSAYSNWNISSGDTIFLPYSYNSLGSGTVTISPISSTGVTGLTATCIGSPVTIGAGTGILKFAITGTPATAGTASFNLLLLGTSCSLTYPVSTGATVSALNCGGTTIAKYLSSGFSANGNTITIPYTGATAGGYPAQSVASTGVTGVTATIAAGTLPAGSGNLVYTLSGTPSGTGTATFNFNIAGQACAFSTTVYSGAITSITNSASPAIEYNIKVASDTNFYVAPYGDGTGNGTQFIIWNHPTPANRIWNFVNAGSGQYAVYNPASGRVADVAFGTPTNGANVQLWSSSFAAATGTQRVTLNAASGAVFGGGTISIRPADDTTKCWDIYLGNIANNSAIKIYGYNGNAAQLFTLSPVQTLTNGAAVSNYGVVFGYLGGNSGTYPAQTIASTGVTGLTATLAAGSFNNGSALEFLRFVISGTPSAAGTATFPVFIGGQSFTFSLTVN